MEVKLYVSNLAVSTTENALRQLFSQSGQVTSVSLIRDRKNGLSRGFAFVTMATAAEAQTAMVKFHEVTLAGRRLTVKLAEQHTKAPAQSQSRLSAFSVAGRSVRVSTLMAGKPGAGYQSKLSAFGPGSGGPTPPRRRRATSVIRIQELPCHSKLMIE